MYMLRIYSTYTDQNILIFWLTKIFRYALYMLYKQQHLSVSGQAADPARQHPPVEYVLPRSTSEGLTTSSAKSLSFYAFWTEMQPQLFHISTAADSWTLLSAAVQMVRALPRGGTAMFTRSTPGCGTLDGPSLAWAASLWPRLRRSTGSPGQTRRLPSADGQLSWLASLSDLDMVYVWYIHGIYMVYTWYILSYSKSCPLSAIKSLTSSLSHGSCRENPCSIAVFPIHPVLIASLKPCKTKASLKLVYVTHIPYIYMVYVMSIPGMFQVST